MRSFWGENQVAPIRGSIHIILYTKQIFDVMYYSLQGKYFVVSFKYLCDTVS